MSLRTFLLIDSLVLDVAGVFLLVAGHTGLGVIVLGVAALAFAGFLAQRRRSHPGALSRPGHAVPEG